jgi:hypothetical protein
LLVETDTGWEPPRFQTTEPNLFAGGPLAGWVRDRWGLAVSQLRVAETQVDPADGRWAWALVSLANHDPAWTPPPGARWVRHADLAALTLAHPEQRSTLETWLAELETGVLPPLRAPWARPGWWAALNAWVESALAGRGQTMIAGLEQRKTWAISCLLRGETTGGAIYVKGCATLPLFTNEAAITADLAARYPAWVPTPLAVEREQRWMLLADFGGELLSAAPRAAWEPTVDAFATLQRDSVGQVDSLRAAGCLDRRLDRLASAIPTLLDGVVAHNSGLTAEEVAAFAARLPELAAACAELAGAGIPAALVHGDLHENNIAIVNGQPLFFDWSDACIAHPFFDLATLFYTEYFAEHPAERDAVRDRYLSHWTAYAPLPDLRRLAALATTLGSLHQVVSYISIVQNIEPSSHRENAEGIDEFVRAILGSE